VTDVERVGGTVEMSGRAMDSDDIVEASHRLESLDALSDVVIDKVAPRGGDDDMVSDRGAIGDGLGE
jgi:hypothetical protein